MSSVRAISLLLAPRAISRSTSCSRGDRGEASPAGAGVGVVHDFALPAAPDLVRVIPDQISLTRAFWLIRHADDGRVARLNRFADQLVRAARAEMARLESDQP